LKKPEPILHRSIKYYLAKHRKLKTLYNDLRRDTRYRYVGDYPLLATICHIAHDKGLTFSKAETHQALKACIDKEFIRIPVNHALVKQLLVV